MPRARESRRGPRASTRTRTARQQWLMSHRCTLTLVLIFTRHFTMVAQGHSSAGMALQVALLPALGSALFWAPAFPRDRAEVGVRKSKGVVPAPVIYGGRGFNALVASQRHVGDRLSHGTGWQR